MQYWKGTRILKKKYIITQKISFWKKIEKLVFLIPILYIINYVIKKYSDETMYENSIYMALVIVALGILSTIPIIIIFKTISSQLRQMRVKQSTFKAVSDIDYYREKLSEISPIEISVLTDLEIEPKKDITALLLFYQLKGIIEINADKVTVKNANHPLVGQSDKLLIKELVKGNRPFYENSEGLSLWKEMAFKKACRREWFKAAKENTKPTAKGCLGGILFLLGPLLTLAAIQYVEPVKYFYDFVEAAPEVAGNMYLAQSIAKDPALLKGFLIAMPIIIFGFSCILLPVVGIISAIIYMKKSPKIQRTPEANELTEYIYGLKNFIHDFSQLSKAEKEHLVLWDDFLIYAVVLEENQQIVDEIFQLRRLNILDYLVEI